MQLLMKADMSHTAAFLDAITASGLTPPTEILDDGKRHRFSSSGKPKDDTGWYILHGDDRPAGAFGCWRSGISVTWKHDAPKTPFTAEQRAAWKQRIADVEAARAADLAEAAAYAAAESLKMWTAAREDAAHDYLARKKIPALGARVLKNMLLIPVKHGAGPMVGVQRIWPDGTKRPVKGTPMQGAYHVIGKPARDGRVVICEGYATGVSIHMATGYCVVVAFNAGNLLPVSEKIRKAMPGAEIIIAADDDAWTVRPATHPNAGAPWNPGIEAAAVAAVAIGASIAAPVWMENNRATGQTDFNDLHADEGLDAVKACFNNPVPPAPVEPDQADSAAVIHTGNPVNSEAGAPFPPAGTAAAPAASTGPGAGVSPVSASEIVAAASDFAPEYSEADMATRHVNRMGGNALWCETWGKWLIWKGSRWVHDDTLMVRELVTQTCKQAAYELAGRMDITEAKKSSRSDKLTSYRGIVSIESLARGDRRIASHPDDWDADLWALNTPGGVVDLRTGKITPHSREHRMTKATSVAPGGACPTWMKFLDRATGGDKDLQSFLKRMCGYSLTGEVREHALFFVYGTGGNGKGTFLNTITSIMGDYQKVSGAEVFTESNNDRHTTELARLQGARLVTAQETEEGKRWAESRIKILTGGDPITARYMRQDDFTYMPQFKLVIVGNHKPSFRSVDEAIRRRLHLIPFTAVIPKEEKDPLLAAKLKAESAGILSWMIEGCVEWEKMGLNPPAIVKEKTEEYLGAEDSLQLWLDECCEIGIGFTKSATLFASWSKWCDDAGEYVGTQKRLLARLETRGIQIGQKFQGQRGCSGIKMKFLENESF